MLLMSQLGWVGLGKETTQGTSVSSTLFVPATAIKPEDVLAYVKDTSIANNATLVRGVYQGEEDSVFAFDGLLYPEVVGPLLVAAGLADTYASSTSSTGTHTFKLPAAGTQPPSYSLTAYDNVDYRRYPGSVMDSLTITVDSKGAAKYTTAWKGWPSVSSASSAPSFPTSASFLGWQASSTIGGSAVTRFLSASITIKRSTEGIHTLQSTQNPYNVFAGPFEADWKLKAVVENNTEWNHLMSNDQVAFVLALTVGANPILTFTTTKAAWTKASVDYSQKYVQLEADVTGVYSSTDGSAVAVTLFNSTTTTY